MRITEKDLEIAINRLNNLTNNPTEPWSKNKKGKIKANIGNYHIDYAYGGYVLCEMTNINGGIRNIFNKCKTKRELYNQIHAYMLGIEDYKEV